MGNLTVTRHIEGKRNRRKQLCLNKWMAEQQQRRLVKWKSNKKQDVVESHDKKYPADVASICLQHLGRENLLLFRHIVFSFLYIQQTPFANNLACLLRCLFFCYKELVYYNLHNYLSCLPSSTHSENFPIKHLSECDYSRYVTFHRQLSKHVPSFHTL